MSEKNKMPPESLTHPVIHEVDLDREDGDEAVDQAIWEYIHEVLARSDVPAEQYVNQYYASLDPNGPSAWRKKTERALVLEELFAQERQKLLHDLPDLFVRVALSDDSMRGRMARWSVQQLGESASGQPEYIVCVPIAVSAETDETFTAFFAEISRQTRIQDAEIIVYANYISDRADAHRDPVRRITELQEYIHTNFPGLNVRFCLREYTHGQLAESSMHTIRSDMMDVVALDGVQRGIDPTTPFIWLDLDLVKAQKDALNTLARNVKQNHEPFVVGQVRLTDSVSVAREKPDLSDSHTLAVAHEHIRRRLSREDKLDAVIEENGFCFHLATYALSGGMSVHQEALGETANIASKYFYTVIAQHPGVINDILERDGIQKLTIEDVLFPYVASSGGQIKRVDAARVYMSNRRIAHKLNLDDGVEEPEVYDHEEFIDETYRSSPVGAHIGRAEAARIISVLIDRSDMDLKDKEKLRKKYLTN